MSLILLAVHVHMSES